MTTLATGHREFNLFIKFKKDILLLFDNNKMSVLSKNLTCISRVTTVHSHTELCGQMPSIGV